MNVEIVKFKDGRFAVRKYVNSEPRYLDRNYPLLGRGLMFASMHCKVDTLKEAQAVLDGAADEGEPIS